MKFKKSSNETKIDWIAYEKELKMRKKQDIFNECKRDLHSMTMKDDERNLFLSHEYNDALKDMTIFNQTDFDYYRYEKELTLGEFND